MVSGAVIVGRPIGPGMIRPFSVRDFIDLQEQCGLGLMARVPIAVAYPSSFKNGAAYQEGVLVSITGPENKNPEQFREYVAKRLIIAAKKAESIYCSSRQKGVDPWNSDLDHSKVCHVDSGPDNKLIWRPYMAVIETYLDEDARGCYKGIANDLVLKTRDHRIEDYGRFQRRIAEEAIVRIVEARFPK